MIQMYRAKVPGLYIWHRAEEIGRKGSQWILEKNSTILNGITMAIALDRRSDDSIITYQSGDRCCSDEFAEALAQLLNNNSPFKYIKDRTGSYTDTYTYTGLIGECTNISVGYTAAHSKFEMLDLEHAMGLRDVLCSPEFSIGLADIVIKRKPGEKEVSAYKSYTYTGKHNSDLMEEWGFGGESGYYGQSYGTNSWPNRHHNVGGHGYRHFKGDEVNPEPKGTELVLPNTGNGKPATRIIYPKTEIDEIIGSAGVPPEDDDAADEKDLVMMTKLVERNHMAIMEILDQIAYDSPDAIAQLIQDSSMDAKELMDEIMNLNGGQVNC
jgi:hypothetical protein